MTRDEWLAHRDQVHAKVNAIMSLHNVLVLDTESTGLDAIRKSFISLWSTGPATCSFIPSRDPHASCPPTQGPRPRFRGTCQYDGPYSTADHAPAQKTLEGLVVRLLLLSGIFGH